MFMEPDRKYKCEVCGTRLVDQGLCADCQKAVQDATEQAKKLIEQKNS